MPGNEQAKYYEFNEGDCCNKIHPILQEARVVNTSSNKGMDYCNKYILCQ